MKTYGKNSALAALRLVVMACLVERKITGPRLRHLQRLTELLKLTPAHLSIVVGDYEADILQAQKKEKEFMFGDSAFPKKGVHACLDEITHLDLQLHCAFNMLQTLLQEPDHTAKEVVFVESCVAYWGIKDAWRELLKTSNARTEVVARPRGSVR